MAYVDFPEDLNGQKDRKAFWLSEEGLTLIAGWRRQGVSLVEIAEKYVGISKTSWWNWYKESGDLRKACAVSLDIANAEVEGSLLRRAIGYDYWEETYELIEGELRLSRKSKKHVPADVKAILSWLYNRLPNRWRAIQEPLESTQYKDTIKSILVAMQEVATSGEEVQLDAEEDTSE